MPFQLGGPGGPGRSKGTKNKIAGRIRKKATRITDELLDEIAAKLPNLSVGQQSRLLAELLPFTLPRLQAASVHIEFEKLPDEELDSIFLKIIAQHEKSISNTTIKGGQNSLPGGLVPKGGNGRGSEGLGDYLDYAEPGSD